MRITNEQTVLYVKFHWKMGRNEDNTLYKIHVPQKDHDTCFKVRRQHIYTIGELQL